MVSINTKLKIVTTLVIVYGVVAMTYISCQGTKTLTKQPNVLVFNTTSMGELYELKSEYQIIQIDSCQYIVGWGGDYQGGPYLTHKGNCTNTKHKQ